MRIQQFLDHHGVASNPFAEEDAQTDPVFKRHCIARTYHPSWAKIFGDPAEPATSIVFGEKGSGKTALRLQIARHLEQYNAAQPEAGVFVVEYDDFNPFLDRFRAALGARRRKAERTLAEWRLWDHIDAMLALAVTQLVDRVLRVPGAPAGPDAKRLAALDRLQVRDLLLLAACYDQSPREAFRARWNRLRRRLRYRPWRAWLSTLLGCAISLGIAGLIGWQRQFDWLASPWPYVFAIAGWMPWAWQSLRWGWRARQIQRGQRALHHEINPLRQVLTALGTTHLANQPLPVAERTDDRYELLVKLQQVLASLGFSGMVVLVDRVDEPHLINGSADLMRAFVWPLLDNKFLKHPGLGLKLLLPRELSQFIEREDRDFYQRARLDKQNMIPSLAWSGEALFDVANDRLLACAADGQHPNLRNWFDSSIGEVRLFEALRSLRAPRHLFKFMYRVLSDHSSAHTDEHPIWQIGSGVFERTLALYLRDQDAFDRGVGAG